MQHIPPQPCEDLAVPANDPTALRPACHRSQQPFVVAPHAARAASSPVVPA
ncbi:MAG: hypothetical protein ACP5QZ_11415 [Candidatus Sumerlaeaceae bacterium]